MFLGIGSCLQEVARHQSSAPGTHYHVVSGRFRVPVLHLGDVKPETRYCDDDYDVDDVDDDDDDDGEAEDYHRHHHQPASSSASSSSSLL